MPAEARIARARALTGTRFRRHGRDPDHGLDCVGLIAIALDRRQCAPTGYALRGGSGERWAALMDAVAWRRRGPLRPGDVLLMQPGPMQFHLGLWTGASLIHADACLRRVVELPGLPRWRRIAAWGRLRRID